MGSGWVIVRTVGRGMGSIKTKRNGDFFFSSRRRHTRYWRDWSSDVCSSDLSAILKIYLPYLSKMKG